MGRKRGVPHRSKLKIAHDRREIARRSLSGEHQADIGASLGLTQQTISLELAAIKKEWMASGVRDFAEAKAVELAKIDLLETTYWQAWEASKGERSRRTQVIRPGTGKDSQPDMQLLTIHTEDTAGDKKWLEGVQRCIDQRCAINGLIAPAKIASPTADGRNAASRSMVGFYVSEQLASLLEG